MESNHPTYSNGLDTMTLTAFMGNFYVWLNQDIVFSTRSYSSALNSLEIKATSLQLETTVIDRPSSAT